MVFIKQNEKPIEIEYVLPDSSDSTALVNNLVPSFLFEGERCYIDDYIRIHDNYWFGGRGWEYPDYIHGYDCFDYSKYVKYIEIVDDDHVNVYREES